MNDKEIKNMVDKIIDLMQDKKAKDITILNVKKLTSLTDYFILCTSESTPQTKAVMDHIYKSMREEGFRPNNLEDTKSLEWVAMDYFNIIIHILMKKPEIIINLNVYGVMRK